jgi:hypothetical protein
LQQPHAGRKFGRLMLTFLSESICRMLGRTPRRPALRALPAGPDFNSDLRVLMGAFRRAELRLVSEPEDHDIPVAAPGAAAFVAGQGARVYSLDVFRDRGPRRPRAA